MRVATIDIGTNSVLLLVAEVTAGGEAKAVLERATITRLGQGVDQTRRLAPEAVARTRACLESYADEVKRAGAERVRIVGTSALRDAAGSDELRAMVEARFHAPLEVISGGDEARLTFEGALAGLPARASEVVVFDIGGGSTEVVQGISTARGPRISFAESVDLGSVRLTERHLRSDPPAAGELEALRADVRRGLARLPPLRCDYPVGIAGTMTTLAAVARAIVPYEGERVHGATLERNEIEATAEQLRSVPVATRRNLPGMEPKRADVIVAGAELALLVLDHLGANGVVISDRGVRWGLALDLGRQP